MTMDSKLDVIQNGGMENPTNKTKDKTDSKQENSNKASWNDSENKTNKKNKMTDSKRKRRHLKEMLQASTEGIEPGEKKNIEQEEDLAEKRSTRSLRKRKIKEDFTYFIDDKEDFSFSDDSRTDEYRPSISEDDEEYGTNRKKRKTTPKEKPNKLKDKKTRSRKSIKLEPPDENSQQANTSLNMPDLFRMSAISTAKTYKPSKKQRRLSSDSDDSEAVDDLSVEEEEVSNSISKKKNATMPRKNNYGQPYSITGFWYIASGYLEDLTSLLQKFEAQESWRFEAFSSCWKEMKFSLIFRGRQSFKELLEFSEEVARITRNFLDGSHSRKMRIGALYTLYGLYYKHPMRHFFKIRITKDEYYTLINLIQPFRHNEDNRDPAVIFRTLEADGAFYHCATSDEMCLSFYCGEREPVEQRYKRQCLASSSEVLRAMPLENLDADNSLMEQYFNMKTAVFGDETSSLKEMSMVDKSLLLEVRKTVDWLKEDIEVALNIRKPSKPTLPDSQLQDMPDIGKRRAEIREKALGTDTTEAYTKTRGLLQQDKQITSRRSRNGCGGNKARLCSKGLQKEDLCLPEGNGSVESKDRKNSSSLSQMLNDSKLRNFMKPPSTDVLSRSVKRRKSPSNCDLPSDQEIDIESAQHSDGDDSLSNQNQTFSKEMSVCHELSPLPKPVKQPRERWRTKVLFEAMKTAQKSKDKSERITHTPKRRGRKKVQGIQNIKPEPFDSPPESRPIKEEREQEGNEYDHSDDNGYIVLELELSGEDSSKRSMKVKITRNLWKSVSEDQEKLIAFKKKITSTMLQGRKFTDEELRSIRTKITSPGMSPQTSKAVSPVLPEKQKKVSEVEIQSPAQSGINKKRGLQLMAVKIGNKTRLIPMPINKNETEAPLSRVLFKETFNNPGKVSVETSTDLVQSQFHSSTHVHLKSPEKVPSRQKTFVKHGRGQMGTGTNPVFKLDFPLKQNESESTQEDNTNLLDQENPLEYNVSNFEHRRAENKKEFATYNSPIDLGNNVSGNAYFGHSQLTDAQVIDTEQEGVTFSFPEDTSSEIESFDIVQQDHIQPSVCSGQHIIPAISTPVPTTYIPPASPWVPPGNISITRSPLPERLPSPRQVPLYRTLTPHNSNKPEIGLQSFILKPIVNINTSSAQTSEASYIEDSLVPVTSLQILRNPECQTLSTFSEVAEVHTLQPLVQFRPFETGFAKTAYLSEHIDFAHQEASQEPSKSEYQNKTERIQLPSTLVESFREVSGPSKAKISSTVDSSNNDSDGPLNSSMGKCQNLSGVVRNSPVCSFLYSPKYKALSKLKEAEGIATGTPVSVNKPRVPFILKHSLARKRKI